MFSGGGITPSRVILSQNGLQKKKKNKWDLREITQITFFVAFFYRTEIKSMIKKIKTLSIRSPPLRCLKKYR